MLRLGCLALWLQCAVPARAAHPILTQAPEFPVTEVWVNAKPLTLTRLAERRVTLVAFINTANSNSLRAIKQLNKWHEAYALGGVMVIGVHTPIYSFQRDAALMKREIERLGIDFPVVLDNERALWKSYGVEGWPTFYVLDRKGRIAFDLTGEARYTELEQELRAAVDALGYKPPESLVAVDPKAEDCGAVTAERAVPKDKPVPEAQLDQGNQVITTAQDGRIERVGKWKLEDDALRPLPKEDEYAAAPSLRIVYRGAQAFAVLGPGGANKTSRIDVKQDDLWLHTGNAGPDVEFDQDGHSYVEVSEPRLYLLTRNSNDNPHLLSFSPTRSGAAVYGFSFSDRCLPYAP